MIVYRGFSAVGLSNPRDPKNVGAALRACGAFNAAFLAYTGDRYKHTGVDTQKAYRHMPLLHTGSDHASILSVLPHDCVPVAVEITVDAVALETYKHPERAYYVFGPEDGSIDAEVIARCKHVVRIGSRYCINLAMAVSIVLYDRQAKGTADNTAYEGGQPMAAQAQR